MAHARLPEDLEGALTAAQVAAYYGVTQRWIRRLAREEGMPSEHVGRNVRFRLSQVDPWMRARTERLRRGA